MERDKKKAGKKIVKAAAAVALLEVLPKYSSVTEVKSAA